MLNEQRFNFDIYAIIEGGQELYFGHETQVNVNVVERVTIAVSNEDSELKKCYISPTKRRGVERRTLIWAPLGNELLGQKLDCGIPNTCGETNCPICRVFGALIPGERTYVGRLTHGGGVAIQPLNPEEKQRAMHPSLIRQEGDETPMPFKREYNEPGLLYPIYNHCMSMTDSEFSSVAYAFMSALARLGAGNPKGVKVYDAPLIKEDVDEPWIVVDRYLAPLGKRPVISPSITDVGAAKKQFKKAVFSVAGDEQKPTDELTKGKFHRYVGDTAISKLSEYLIEFEKEELNVDA